MDFTPDMLAFQGTLTSCNLKIPFSTLNHRGGNERNILEIVTTVFKYLHDKKYITKDDIAPTAVNKIKKYFLYLTLNTDFKTVDELVDVPEIDHVIWTLPVIPQVLFCDLVCALNMDIFVGELITYGTPKLSMEVFKTFADSLNYLKNDKFLERLKIITEAGYKMITRLAFYDLDEIEFKNILKEAFETFNCCVLLFISPPEHFNISNMKGSDYYKYQGNTLENLIDITNECIEAYHKQILFTVEQNNLYCLTIHDSLVKLNTPTLSIRDLNLEHLEVIEKCLEALLDKISNIVMLVSVDVFCCWSEIEFNGKTMQRVIGEKCHNLLQNIKTIKKFEKHLTNEMLPQLAIKPIDIHDIIKSADNEMLVQKANEKHDDQNLWLKALMKHEDFYNNLNFIQAVIDNINRMEINFEDVKTIIDNVFANTDSLNELKVVVVKLFGLLSVDEKKIITHTIFPNNFNDTLDYDGSENTRNEIFNKFKSAKSNDYNQVYDIFIMNPRKLFKKLIWAGTESEKLMLLCVDLIKVLSEFTSYNYINEEPTLILILNDKITEIKTDKEIVNFVNIVNELSRFMCHKTLALKFLYPNIHKALIDKDVMKLKICASVSIDIEQICPLRVMYGYMFELARANLNKSSAWASLLEDLISSQFMMKPVTDVDKTWLISKLSFLNPLNRFYFFSLGTDFLESVTGLKQYGNYSNILVLVKVLMNTINIEWVMIWRSLKRKHSSSEAIELLNKCLLIIVAIHNESVKEATRVSLARCITAYTYILKNDDNLLSSKTHDSFSDVIADDKSNHTKIKELLVSILNSLSENELNSVSHVILPLILEVVKTGCINECFVNSLKHKEFASKVDKMINTSNYQH